MPRVPFELSDYIIDFLHDDPKALRSCALTCYSWLFASRFHLFRSISLQNRSVADHLERLLRASPELGLYVRDLTVTKFTTNESESAPTAPPPTPAVPAPAPDAAPAPTKVLDTALPRILGALPALHTLSLSHTDMKCIGGMHAVRLPTVSALSVSFCQFADFADVVDLVGCFPALRELSLAGLTWKEEVRTPTAVLAPTLRTLALGRDLDSERLFAWFEAAAFHTSVTALAVRCASERDAALVGPFLERVGGSLRSLELDWSFTGDKTILLPDSVSLGGCTALDALSLRFPVHYSAHLPWVSSLLATLGAAARVRSVACDIRLLGSLDALDWDALAAALASDAYRGLQALRFAVNLWPGVHKDIGEVDSLVRARLASFDKKGMVHVAKA